MKRKKTILILAFWAIFLPAICLASYSYTPMESIPGFGAPTSFPEYIQAVYKFLLWTIGISAMLMISIGGFMYLTSAGNASQAGKAKGVITDAIIGLAMALLSWLLLYTINPSLVTFKTNFTSESGAPGTPGAAGTPGTSTGPGGTTDGYKAACPNTSSTTPIDYAKAAQDASITVNSKCSSYDFTNSSGVDPKLLRSIAQLESSCGTNKGPSEKNACGMMQMLESTASRLAGRAVTCDELKNDDSLAISLAAKYVAEGASSSCVSNAKDKNSAIFAGYNSGYACNSSACSGSKHALCASSDCSGALAYECCVNPGGLDESINYAWNGMGILKKQ